MKFIMRPVLFFFLFISLFTTTSAGIFTITNNTDFGPGSLRDALQSAAANGTATIDTILFNLPGTTLTDRTIIINGTLQFSGNLVVDGTTQPGGSFGITDCKVILKKSGVIMCSGIIMSNLSHIEIYGIWFKNFDYFFNLSGDCHGYAIMMNQATDITIGKQGKGNAFTNHHTQSIWHKNYFGINYLNPNAFADTIRIEHNIFGLNDAGTAIDLAMLEGIDLGNGRNVTINSNKGNCYVNVGSASQEGNGFVKFTDNNFANPVNPSQYGFGSFGITKQGLTSTYVNYDLQVSGNKISNNNQNCIILWDMRGKIVVENNELGAYYDMKNQPTENTGLAMIRCITTNASKINNNIILNRKRGVWLTGCGRVSINNNSIFCNNKGIFIESSVVTVPTVSINNITAANVSGITIPGGKVELFITDSCTNLCENGKLSLGTTIANSGGAFNFSISTTGLFSATVTTSDSISSEFNGVKVDTLSATVKNATCSNNNGSITGIVIRNASSWYWENDLNQIISTTDTNLYNLPPGRYRLVLHEVNVACSVITGFYQILQIPQPVLSGNPFTITNPTCGQPGGKIVFTGIRPAGSVNRWLDNSGNVIQQYGDSVVNLWPGQYFFKLYLWEDTTCFSLYGPFVLVNLSGPDLNVSSVQIINARCGNANGSITGITAGNVTGAPFIQWLNTANIPVGSSLNLTNVPAESYRLKFKDQSSCDTIITAFYTIMDIGKITLNTANKIINPAGCTVNNGSIENISAVGATIYQWQNLTTNLPAGNTLSINNLAVADYQLTVSNFYGCSNVSPVISVPTAAFSQIDVVNAEVYNATCSLNNGSIYILGFTKDSSRYNFKWIDSATNQTLTTGIFVTNLGAGTYILNATDTNGCEKNIYKKILNAFPKPSIDLSSLVVTADNCSLQIGSIAGIKINGLQGPTNFAWIDQANNQIGNNLPLNNLGAGQYKIIVKDGVVCTVESQWIILGNINTILETPQYDDQTINKNSIAKFNIKNFHAGTYILYRDAAATQELQRNSTGIFTTGPFLKDTVFYIKYTTVSCNSNLKQVRVKVIETSDIYVPTAFTPNNDGKNDMLKAYVYGPIKLQYFIIYNRYGQMVFTSNDFNSGWNGTYKGHQSDAGTYSWILKAIDELKGIVIEQKGTFILIR